MNKRLPLILTLLFCFVMGTFADKVITFKENTSSSDASKLLTTVEDMIASGAEYVDSIDAANCVYLGKQGCGLKLGSSKAAGSFTIVLKEASNATAIKYKAKWYKANEKSIVVAGSQNDTLASSIEEYAVTLDGSPLTTISINTPTKRAYISEVTIVDDAPVSVTAPVITGTTPFVDSTLVTITSDSKVYYTTDNTDPTAESTEYTAPFTIKEACTVKAIAVDGSAQSPVATMTFDVIPSYSTLAEVNALEANAQFCYTGTAYVVANPNNKHVYVQDETGTSFVYDSTQKTDLAVGSAVTPGWTGSITVYNGLTEVIPSSTLTAVEGASKEIVYSELSKDDVVLDKVNTVGYLNEVTYQKAATGKNLTIILSDSTEIAGYNNFGIEIADAVEGETYNILGVVSRYKENVQFQPIEITRVAKDMDIVLELPEACDIATNVAVAIDSVKVKGDNVGSLTIKLGDTTGTYAVSKSIEVGGPVSVIGNEEKPVTIDASELSTPFILMSATPNAEADSLGFFHADSVSLEGLKITGLKTQLFYANKTKYLFDNVSLKNSIVNVTCATTDGATTENKRNIFDTQNGGVIATLEIENSTIYANPAHTGALYSSQSGQKATEAGLDMQTISIKNSTLYNIAYNKNVNSHRQANQKWLTYILQNSIILDCGKDGQFVKGLNQGQQGANPVWNISKNSFLRTVNDTIVDHSSLETTGDTDESEMVLNSVEDYVLFADVANGDFTLDAGCLQAKERIGDPRWLVEYDETKKHETTDAIQSVTEETAANDDAWYTLQGIRVAKPSAGVFIHNGKKVALK